MTSLARGLEVLGCFGPDDRWLANQEIAARTGLAKPTVTRLTYTLVRAGHLRYSRSSNKYALGSASRSLGFVTLAQMDLRRAARPLMQELSQHARGMVHLSVRDGLSMVLVDSYQHHPVSFSVDIGGRVPIATTSIGRAYLFALPPEDRRAVLDELRRARPAEWPRLDKVLEDAAAEYRKVGFCTSLGEWRRDVIGIAVPLLAPDASDPLVVSFSGATFQLDAATLRNEIAPRLLTLAGNVHAALGRD